MQGVLRRVGLLRNKQQQLTILDDCNVVRKPACCSPAGSNLLAGI